MNCINCASPRVRLRYVEYRYLYGVEDPVELVVPDLPVWDCLSCLESWTDHEAETLIDATTLAYLKSIGTPEATLRKAKLIP